MQKFREAHERVVADKVVELQERDAKLQDCHAVINKLRSAMLNTCESIDAMVDETAQLEQQLADSKEETATMAAERDTLLRKAESHAAVLKAAEPLLGEPPEVLTKVQPLSHDHELNYLLNCEHIAQPLLFSLNSAQMKGVVAAIIKCYRTVPGETRDIRRHLPTPHKIGVLTKMNGMRMRLPIGQLQV